MTEPDFFAVFDEADYVPHPTGWESLEHAITRLTHVAERAAALAPEDRIVLSPDLADEPETDLLAMMDEAALGVRAAVAACRRDTWRSLRDRGWTLARIADHWGITPQAVSKAIGRRPK